MESKTDYSLVGRLLRLSLAYRRECALVLSLQIVLLAFGVFGLGLSGVAVDVIRKALDPDAPAPRYPLELAPPAGVSTEKILFAIGALVLAMAAARALSKAPVRHRWNHGGRRRAHVL